MAFTAKDFGPNILNLDGISKKAVEEHLKLYNGYVNKSNEVMEKLKTIDPATANQIFSDFRSLKVDMSFAIAGMQNHEIYFAHLKAGGQMPMGEVKAQIEKDFGGFDGWVKDLKATGIASRGWAWTVWFPEAGRLLNWAGDAQNSYLAWNLRPILAMDVYEHAYFMDFGVNRGGYIDTFLKNIDWDVIGANWEKARK